MCLGGVEASQRREEKEHIFRWQHCTAVPKRCTFVLVDRTSPYHMMNISTRKTPCTRKERLPMGLDQKIIKVDNTDLEKFYVINNRAIIAPPLTLTSIDLIFFVIFNRPRRIRMGRLALSYRGALVG